MVYLFYFLFYERNNTKMRQSYELPQDDGSRRSRCPPSHQEMALTPHYAQASARAPRPSPPSTHSLASTDKVSPHHQPGSTKPRAAPPAPRMARADPPAFGDPPGRTDGLMAPSPMSFGASTPSYSPHTSSAIVTSTRGEYTPTTRSTPPSDEATHSSRPKSSARSSCRLNLAVKTSTSRSSSSPSPPLLKRGGASLAEHRAATVLQCWKRRLWLRRWFDQQARSKERRLRLQALCRGASTYARSVGANRRPPPTPTIKPSDPTESLHPFRTRGQPLPPRKRARRPTRKRRRPGRRHRPRAPDTEGGGLRLCMPLCFWATQTAVAAAYLPSGSGRSEFSPYLPPHKAATAIQHAYRVSTIRRNRRILPRLCGPYHDPPYHDPDYEDYKATYRRNMVELYEYWTVLPDLILYYSTLRGRDMASLPPWSVDMDYYREFVPRYFIEVDALRQW